jgi:hypothetical protein
LSPLRGFSPAQQRSARGRAKQQRSWLGDGDAVGDEDAGGAVGERGGEGELISAAIIDRRPVARTQAAGF